MSQPARGKLRRLLAFQDGRDDIGREEGEGSHRRRGAAYVVVAATVGATAVFLVARTAIDDVLRVKAEPVPHNQR